MDFRHYLLSAAFLVFSVYAVDGYAVDGVLRLPDGFVCVSDLMPDIVCKLRYFGKQNFVGRRINGYHANKCIMSREAVGRLSEVQKDLRPFGLGLRIFDAYRPQRAVQDFVHWAKDLDDIRQKSEYYPNANKKDLFAKGYIASRSGHSRGSTVDLTIVANGVEIDMGSSFDYFGEQSWTEYQKLTPQQRANRLLLKKLMESHGFGSYKKEWWHYTLMNEPYPETYFDFPIQ